MAPKAADKAPIAPTAVALSERTIENHISKILRKLGRASRVEIAAWAIQQRLIAPNFD
jgi:DNA-binding NarL/FixJ family response regulator